MHPSHDPSRTLTIGIALAVAILLRAVPAWTQTAKPDARQATSVVTGTVVDDTGTGIGGAKITLTRDGRGPARVVHADANGGFSFSSVPGPLHLAISAPGFADQTVTAELEPGQVSALPPIRMTLAGGTLSVDVTPPTVEIAERQIKQQEQQRVLGIVPNYFVVYTPDAAPLNMRQKFELTWKSRLDPVQFGVVAIVVGVQQARGDFSGFGDGPSGYAKRYAAAYANVFTRSLVTQVLMPSLFKQDPRYFYKGTGSAKSRIGYALSRAVVRKGDNGRWQPNYSGILGSLAAGALSNLYYPAGSRKGVQLTLENAGISIGGAAIGHLAQEFLWDKLTSHR